MFAVWPFRIPPDALRVEERCSELPKAYGLSAPGPGFPLRVPRRHPGGKQGSGRTQTTPTSPLRPPAGPLVSNQA